MSLRGKLADLNLAEEKHKGYSCWGLKPGSTANGVANAVWFAFVIGLIIYTVVTLALSMTPGHTWQECRPLILDIKDGRVADKRIPGALDMAWSLVPDQDRELFHLYCCHSRQCWDK